MPSRSSIHSGSNPADGMTQRHSGYDEITKPPQRFIFPMCEIANPQKGADETAIVNEPASIDSDDLKRVPGVVGKIGDDVSKSSTDDSAHHDPNADFRSQACRISLSFPKPRPVQNGS